MVEPATARESATNLPTELTSFVGRRSDRSELRHRLTESRLVTLTGFGGMGKTRLALRLASDLRRAFADGVWFVSLEMLTDPEWLADTIASALGIQDRSTRTALVEYLHDKELLLVLDNCEHVIDACAMLTDTLLRTCPKLRVLATSREPMRIHGETVHAVAPLTTPGRDHDPAMLLRYEAVTLFVDRATAAVPGFALTPDNHDDVAAICRRLEGIPLALELVAVRLRAMSPRELARNLTGHWELLNLGSRTAPDRQRTMAACIEWSFELCSDAERDVWARAAVFAGGFELDAAATVCGDGPDDRAVFDILHSLVEKSILVATDDGDRMRFSMLPPITQRGLFRLRQSDTLKDYRRRHRDWVVGLAARSHEEWMSPRQIEWINRLRREEGNMRVALEFCCVEPDEAEPGLRMGADLLEFGQAEGLYRSGRIWFDRLLALNPERTLTRARSLRTACWWATMQGDLVAARQLVSEGRRLAEELGEPARTLLTQTAAFVAMFSGDLTGALELYSEALAGFRASGDVCQEAHTLTLLALTHTFAGNLDRVRSCHEECLAVTKPAGESWFSSYSLWIAGLAALAGGDRDTAASLAKDSLRLKRSMNERLGIGVCLEALAWITTPTDPHRSVVLLGAARNIWDAIETSSKALAGLHDFHLECVAQARSALGDKEFDACWQEGRLLGQAAAVGYALDEAVRPGRTAARRTGASRSGNGVLTPRERQIAELVAEGTNNRDIANALVISKRTVESHVENILTKLGFTSRNQIIAWMVDKQNTEHAVDAQGSGGLLPVRRIVR